MHRMTTTLEEERQAVMTRIKYQAKGTKIIIDASNDATTKSRDELKTCL